MRPPLGGRTRLVIIIININISGWTSVHSRNNKISNEVTAGSLAG